MFLHGSRSFSHDPPSDRLGQVPAGVRAGLGQESPGRERRPCWPFHATTSRGISGPENRGLNPARPISNHPRWPTTKQVRRRRLRPPFSVHNLSYESNSRRFINHTTTRRSWVNTRCGMIDLGLRWQIPGQSARAQRGPQGICTLQQHTITTRVRVVLFVWLCSLAKTH